MNKKILISLILVIIWMGVIFSMSSMNRNDSDSTSRGLTINIIDGVDKVVNAPLETVKKHHEEGFIKQANHLLRKSAHVLSYFVLSILFLNFLMQINKYAYYIRNIINVLFCYLYACTDEVHQMFVTGRGGQFIDVLIDSFGALIGCIFFYLWYKLVMKLKRQKIRNKKHKMSNCLQ